MADIIFRIYYVIQNNLFCNNWPFVLLGFLSTADSVISGNLGLKDQIFALKWVKNNIEYFGGNPEEVTVMGQSAGAVAVGYLLLSEKAKGT